MGLDGDAIGHVAARLEFDDPALLSMFPFPHELTVLAELRGRRLTLTTSARATSAAGLPIAFGYHPYFQLPGTPRSDWEIEAGLTEQLVLDDRGIPTGDRRPAQVASGRLAGHTFDDAFLAPDGGKFSLVGGSKRIDVRFESGYGYSQLFAPEEDDVLAFEPMTAATNALVRGGTDLTVLGEDETYEARFSVAIEDG